MLSYRKICSAIAIMDLVVGLMFIMANVYLVKESVTESNKKEHEMFQLQAEMFHADAVTDQIFSDANKMHEKKMAEYRILRRFTSMYMLAFMLGLCNFYITWKLLLRNTKEHLEGLDFSVIFWIFWNASSLLLMLVVFGLVQHFFQGASQYVGNFETVVYLAYVSCRVATTMIMIITERYMGENLRKLVAIVQRIKNRQAPIIVEV